MQVMLEAMNDGVIPVDSEKLSLLVEELETFQTLFRELSCLFTHTPDASDEIEAPHDAAVSAPSGFSDGTEVFAVAGPLDAAKRAHEAAKGPHDGDYLALKTSKKILFSVYERTELLFIKRKISVRLRLAKSSAIEGIHEAFLPCSNTKTLERILENLFLNEARYVVAGGEVIVTLGVCGSGAAQEGLCNVGECEASSRAANPLCYAVLRIEDSGPGISEEEMPYIFKKGFRANPAASTVPEGKGLGLSYVQHEVEKAGGKIGVSRSELGGTTFTISLPLLLSPL